MASNSALISSGLLVLGKIVVDRLDTVNGRGLDLTLGDLCQRREWHPGTFGNAPLRDALGAQIFHYRIVYFCRGIHGRR